MSGKELKLPITNSKYSSTNINIAKSPAAIYTLASPSLMAKENGIQMNDQRSFNNKKCLAILVSTDHPVIGPELD